VDTDLILLLDNSANVSPNNFHKVRIFMDRFAATFTAHRGSRLGLRVFATQPQTIFELDNIQTPAEMSLHILAAPYFGAQGSYVHNALDEAREEYQRLGDADVPQNVVLITSGPSFDSRLTREAGQALKAAGVRSFAVGVTDTVVDSELLDIAGGEQEQVYKAKTYEGLEEFLQDLILGACNNEVSEYCCRMCTQLFY
jgi:hypothetical protein